MKTSPAARWAPVLGILAPLLWFFGIAVSESGEAPAEQASAEEILTYFQEETTAILLGGILFILGTLGFILFITVLRDRWRASGASESASTLAYVTGLVGAAFLAATWGPQLGIAIAIEEMDVSLAPATAEMAWHAGSGFFVLGEMILALFLFATAALMMRTVVLPSWLGWIAILLGVVALVPPIGWAAMIFGLPIWLILTSIFLLIGGSKTPATTSTSS